MFALLPRSALSTGFHITKPEAGEWAIAAPGHLLYIRAIFEALGKNKIDSI